MLDVGVDEVGIRDEGGQSGCTTHNFFEELYPWRTGITAVGLHDGAGFRAAYPEIEYVPADGCALPFADGAFDVYFSNAVIEHVGGVDRQRAFVAEAVRVSRRVFLTTPNRWFPIEVHTRLPARALASGSRLASCVRHRSQAVGKGEPSARPGRPALSLPGSGADRQPRHDARGDHVSGPPAAARARRARGRPRRPQPRDGRAVARRRARPARSTSSPPGRRRCSLLALAVALWSARRPAAREGCRLAGARLHRRSSWSTRCSHSTGSAERRRRRGCSMRFGTTWFRSAAYTLGRLAAVSSRDRRDLAWLAVGVGCVLSVWGFVDVYQVPLQWWRDSGVPGWFSSSSRSTTVPGSRICRRTGSTTPVTRTTRYAGWSRRSSARWRRRTCSSPRCCSSRRASGSGAGAVPPAVRLLSQVCSGRTPAPPRSHWRSASSSSRRLSAAGFRASRRR